MALYDHLNDEMVSAALTTHQSGGVGLAVGSQTGRRYSAFYAMADRYLRVYNLPPGYQVRVGSAIAVADSDGLATVDLLTVPFPQAVIEVLDAAGVVVSTHTPDDGVWGGDEYLWEGDYAAAVLADAPLGYWRQGDKAGSTMTDSSGHGRHGTYEQAPVLGQPGALVNDPDPSVHYGQADTAVVPDAPWMDVPQLTFEAWLFPTAKLGIVTYNVYRWGDTTNNDQWAFFKTAQDRLAFQVRVGSSNVQAVCQTPIQLNTWYHFVATYDGTALRVYLNGELEATTVAPGSVAFGSSSIRIARRGLAYPSGQTNWYVGRFDEIAFYDHALSATRIKTHYLLAITPKSAVPPHQPTISVVVRGQGKVTLLSSPFSSDDPDAEHAASRWRVTTADDPDFEAPVYDSGWIEDLTEHTVAGLPAGPQLLAVVAHRDRRGNESPWSEPAAFRASTWEPCPPPPATEWEPCEEPVSPVRLEAFAWWPLQEASAGDGASDATGNGHDGTYGPDVIFRVPGPGGGSKYAVRVSATSPTAGLTTPSIDRGAGGNFPSPGAADSNPNYRAPTIHTNFTMAVTVRPTETTAIPSKMSDPPGTGPIVSAQTPNRFINVPAHGNRGNPTDSTDIHAGVGLIIGTNAVIVAEHAHNHVPVRAIYQGDLSGWHRICFVYRGDPRLAGAVRIYIDGVYAGELPGSYGEGSSVKVRPFLVGPWLTLGPQVSWVNNFGGDVADLTVWDRALTDEEIMADAQGAGLWEPAFVRPSTSWERC
ncbi:MAG TPA: LamG-like jellyroll fold domain-containing protein [Micromonosporaceae bacterium]|nr:LamG-like jellyroll fold domain-containing protein [Micromonosporaceae bacterium]